MNHYTHQENTHTKNLLFAPNHLIFPNKSTNNAKQRSEGKKRVLRWLSFKFVYSYHVLWLLALAVCNIFIMQSFPAQSDAIRIAYSSHVVYEISVSLPIHAIANIFIVAFIGGCGGGISLLLLYKWGPIVKTHRTDYHSP